MNDLIHIKMTLFSTNFPAWLC